MGISWIKSAGRSARSASHSCRGLRAKTLSNRYSGPFGCDSTSSFEQLDTDYGSLIGIIGHRTRVYEVMRGDRPLSLKMMRRLHRKFQIPAEILIKRPKRRRTKRRVA